MTGRPRELGGGRGLLDTLVLTVPVAVPLSMALLFQVLRARVGPRRAYNVGFAVYWAGWCLAAPATVLGARPALRLLVSGRRPRNVVLALSWLPVVGAAVTELLPHRRQVNAPVAAVMLVTALVNAPLEELLWRGVFLARFPDDPIRGSCWPLLGFSLWHLAPQVILPSRHGRWTFVVSAGLVGAASSWASWRGQGLRWTILPHLLTDACGVSAARFRLTGRA